MTDSKNVIERINDARRIIAGEDFSKSGTVKGAQSYNFIPIGQILAAVRKAHAQAGVTVVFGTPEYEVQKNERRWTYDKTYTDQYTSKEKKTQWHAAIGHIHVTIYGSSVEDLIETDVPFEAQDNSDKLTNKIITNAERCLYRVLYAIDEGDGSDPEAYNEPMIDPSVRGSFETGDAYVQRETGAAPRKARAQAAEGDSFFGNAQRNPLPKEARQ